MRRLSQSHHRDLWQHRNIDPGQGLQLATLLELLQDLLEAALQLRLVLPDQILLLLPLQPLHVVLLGHLHAQDLLVLRQLAEIGGGENRRAEVKSG